jgi:Icc-related predicted phosphoesterase
VKLHVFGRQATEDKALKLFYASDVHGSGICWRKFVGAGRFYGADCLVMGGDLTGKAIVPIECDAFDHFSAEFLGEHHEGSGKEQLGSLLDAIRYNGLYPWVASREEIERHRTDGGARDALFEQVMLEETRSWMRLADERLAGSGIAIFVMAGNDDPWTVDAVIAQSSVVVSCDDRLVRVGEHEMISCSYSNPTPWKSPRELDEDALYRHLKDLAEQIEDPSSAIFNLHVPPYGSGLDMAIEVNPLDLSPVHKDGQPNVIPVGSRAVRQIIEEYQPLLSLHGHIHESRADARIGRTLAINAGSEYNSGRIHGVLVQLRRDRVLHQYVQG